MRNNEPVSQFYRQIAILCLDNIHAGIDFSNRINFCDSRYLEKINLTNMYKCCICFLIQIILLMSMQIYLHTSRNGIQSPPLCKIISHIMQCYTN